MEFQVKWMKSEFRNFRLLDDRSVDHSKDLPGIFAFYRLFLYEITPRSEQLHKLPTKEFFLLLKSHLRFACYEIVFTEISQYFFHL